MKLKKYIGVTAAAVMLLAGCGQSASGEKLRLKFPTASTSGSIYSIGAATANLWNETIPGLEVSVEASNGGVQNLGLMQAGEAQVSVAVTSIISEQKEGLNKFEGKAYDGVRILTALYPNYNQIVVSGDSGIESLGDISGKRFAPGAAGSTTELETRLHLTQAGLSYPDGFKPQFVGFTEAVDLIRNKQLEGAWIQAGLPTSAVTEICTTAGGRLISVDEEVIDALTQQYPWYNRAVIPAGTYEGQEEDVVTTSIPITIIVDESVPQEQVYQMTKVFWENIDTLKKTHNALSQLSIEGAAKNLGGIALHPGAERYYREMGVL